MPGHHEMFFGMRCELDVGIQDQTTGLLSGNLRCYLNFIYLNFIYLNLVYHSQEFCHAIYTALNLGSPIRASGI